MAPLRRHIVVFLSTMFAVIYKRCALFAFFKIIIAAAGLYFWYKSTIFAK